MPSGVVACTSRPSTPPRCSPSSAAPPPRAPRSPRRRQRGSRAWWRSPTSVPPRARRPRSCRRRRSERGRRRRARWFDSPEWVALRPRRAVARHGRVCWRPHGSRPLLRTARPGAPRTAQAGLRGGLRAWRSRACSAQASARGRADAHRALAAGWSPATNRWAAPRRDLSCRALRGRADSRSKRPPRYAACATPPASLPRATPAWQPRCVRCAGTQGGLAEELAAARGEAGGGARPARESARRRGAAAGARGCVERPGLSGAGTRLHCDCVHAEAWQRRAWPLTWIEVEWLHSRRSFGSGPAQEICLLYSVSVPYCRWWVLWQFFGNFLAIFFFLP